MGDATDHVHDEEQEPDGGLTCAEVVEIVTDYLEDMLEAPDRERFEEHLAFCPGCDAYLDQMRQTIAVTGRLREDDLPPPVRTSLLDAFRAWRSS